MPFDSNGKASLPPIYKATTGEKVLAEQHNIPLEDIANMLSQCLKRDGSTPAIRNISMSGFLITDLGEAKNPGDAVSKKMLDAAVPIGAIQPFVGDTPPQGWQLCYGQAISRVTYAALFGVIGTKFGAGDKGSTFNLPDLRGRVLVGRDDMGGPAANRVTAAGSGIHAVAVGAVGGAQNHILTAGQMPAHQHYGEGNTADAGGHDHDMGQKEGAYGGLTAIVRAFSNWKASSPNRTSWAGVHRHFFSFFTNWQGGNQPHNNMQPSIIVNYIIRTGV